MTNQFDSKGGDQNIGQGDGAIGQQNNYYGSISPDILTNSGDGEQNTAPGEGAIGKQENNYNVSSLVFLIPALLIGFVAIAGLTGQHWLVSLPNPNPATGVKEVKYREQNIAQGVVAIGKQEVNIYISPGRFEELKTKYAVPDSTLVSFLNILKQANVPYSDVDTKVKEIATPYKDLRARLDSAQSASTDPQVVKLKKEAKQAIEVYDYDKAEKLLEDANRSSSADTHVELALLNEVQLLYYNAAEHWQRAAELVPKKAKDKDSQKKRARYLNKAGHNLNKVSYTKYGEAMRLYEKSLAISQKVGDKAGEGITLDNIRQICEKYSDSDDNYYPLEGAEQCLAISRKIGDKAGEQKILDKIINIYTKGDYISTIKYMKQSLAIKREMSDRKGEAKMLNSLGLVYRAQDKYDKALSSHKESLAISRKLGDREGESISLWNIGRVYEDQGKLSKAEQYMSQAVHLQEKIGYSNLEITPEYPEELEKLRAKIRGEAWEK